MLASPDVIMQADHKPILDRFKIAALNPMQQAVIAAVSKPTDVTLISPTGSGKTLAFLLASLPLLQQGEKGVQLLILVPTRELAMQIEQVFKQMGTGYKINCCYGGHSIRIEKNNLEHPPAVLVGTPGRIAYHIRDFNFEVTGIHTLILDEFDKSLDAGFQQEMSYIIQELKSLRKRILTSATRLSEIPSFVGIQEMAELDFTVEHKKQKAALQIKMVRITGIDKLEALLLLISKLGRGSKIVFCNHRDAVKRISMQLTKLHIDHGVYQGEMEQIDREKALIKVRNGSTNLLIATDIASRGLDIPEIQTIIHYQLPTTEEIMIHRNGRTARMDATGTAYLLLEEKDYVPSYLKTTPQLETLPDKFTMPPSSPWKTLYIAAGKKDKINKTDIVGMLLQKGGLQKEEVGKIEVLDNSAYVAIAGNKIEKTLAIIRQEKIKGRKIKFEIST